MINELDLARDSTTSAEILTQLAESDRTIVVKAIAANPNTPVSLLIKLAEHESEEVRKQIARNPNTPLEILAKFAQSRYSNLVIRQEVAKNKSTPVEILNELASDRSFLVRQAIAYHPQAPASILVALFQDPETNNRDSIEEIARHPNTPEKVLRTLMENRQHWSELYRDCATWHFLEPKIASNPNTPLDILERFVAEVEAGQVEGSDRISASSAFLARAIAANPNTPVSLLIQLLDIIDRSADESDRIYVVSAIAANPNSNADLLGQLSEDKDLKIRRIVASNINTPLAILEMMAKSHVYSVIDGLSKNPQLQPDIQEAKSPNTKIEKLIELSHSPYSFVRKEIEANPNSTADLLGQLSEDEDWEIRRNVARNPKTPLAVLEMLAKSSDRDSFMYSLSKNPQLQPDIQEAKSPNTKIERLIELSHSPYSFVRKEALLNSSIILQFVNEVSRLLAAVSYLDSTTPIENFLKVRK
jgi:hypothetical protein